MNKILTLSVEIIKEATHIRNIVVYQYQIIVSQQKNIAFAAIADILKSGDKTIVKFEQDISRKDIKILIKYTYINKDVEPLCFFNPLIHESNVIWTTEKSW